FKKVGEAYVKVLQYQGDVEAGEADLNLAKTLYDMTVVAFNSGVATGVDKARAESRMLQSETKLLQAKTNLDKSLNALKELLMLPMATPLDLTSPLTAKPSAPPTADRAVATAEAQRPDIRAAKEQIRMAGYEHRAAVGQQVPSLAFGANYGGTGNTPTQNVAGTYQLAGLIQIPLFDGGNTVGEIQVTKSKKKQAQLILGALKQEADKEVRDALDAMKYSQQAIVASKKRVEVAKLELELTRDRFFAGVDDNLELTRAQANLANARDEYIKALADYNNARIMLAYAMGVIRDFNF
ncbi:MAG: TolC family protein, partial [bacterium]|nr:TolC family protein [bacterium]